MAGTLEHIAEAAQAFESISLTEMDAVKLMDRMDTKFLLKASDLPGLFHELAPSYRCLEINGKRGAGYKTLYFDSANLDCYFDHHNGRTFRNKVRMREYVGSDLCFLEVKRKTGRGGTDKVRMRIPAIQEKMNEEQMRFVQEACLRPYSFEDVLWNSFTRYTLVHKEAPERLTIDVKLEFTRKGNSKVIENLVICELKQARVNPNSTFYSAMRKRVVRTAGMSKYCMGLIRTEPKLKKNRFKPTLLQIEQIQKAA